MPCYTQVFARTRRPTQILASLNGMDVYMFPPTPAGTLVCERSSETDLRILLQVANSISRALGRGVPVLAIAGDDFSGFWCALFDGGGWSRLQHNRITEPREFADYPVSRSQAGEICEAFGVGGRVEEVYSALVGPEYDGAVQRHAALALALGLPLWSPGIGYSRIVEGSVPPEAGAPEKPPRSTKSFRPVPEWLAGVVSPNPGERWRMIYERAFVFLVDEFGFERDLKTADPHAIVYRNPDLTIVVEEPSFREWPFYRDDTLGTRLCVIDRARRFVDLARMVEARDPKLLDLCRFVTDAQEQIPLFAEALRKCAADLLAGEYPTISEKKNSAWSFCRFFASEEKEFLALYQS